MKKSPVESHFDNIASKYDFYTKKRDLHYTSLKKLLGTLIPERKNVLEIGCGTGDLLASVNPRRGIGMDISAKMVSRAKTKYKSFKNLKFSTKWPGKFKPVGSRFDYIFMSDVIEHLENPQETFGKISDLIGGKTIFINTMMNPVWIPVESVYNFLGWKMPEGPSRRMKYKELSIMIENSGMKIIKHDYTLLMPIKIPVVTSLLNRYIEKYLKPLCFIEYFVAVKA